jgi:hypothetical protein
MRIRDLMMTHSQPHAPPRACSLFVSRARLAANQGKPS